MRSLGPRRYSDSFEPAPVAYAHLPTPAPVQDVIQAGMQVFTRERDNLGRTKYHVFRAEPQVINSPYGPNEGIQWVPANYTLDRPPGLAFPAGPDFHAAWSRPFSADEYRDAVEEWEREKEKVAREERVGYEREASDNEGEGSTGTGVRAEEESVPIDSLGAEEFGRPRRAVDDRETGIEGYGRVTNYHRPFRPGNIAWAFRSKSLDHTAGRRSRFSFIPSRPNLDLLQTRLSSASVLDDTPDGGSETAALPQDSISRRRVGSPLSSIISQDFHDTEDITFPRLEACTSNLIEAIPEGIGLGYDRLHWIASSAEVDLKDYQPLIVSRIQALHETQLETLCEQVVYDDTLPQEFFTALLAEIRKRYPNISSQDHSTLALREDRVNGHFQTSSSSSASVAADVGLANTPEHVEDRPFQSDSPFCLDGKIIDISRTPVDGGGYSDIWKGTLDGQPVAIKTLRRYAVSERSRIKEKLSRRVWREYLIWQALRHPNILPLLGFSNDLMQDTSLDVPALISPWMGNGTLVAYVEDNPQANKIDLLLEVAKGLSYLHTQNIVHGDIRGGNILVSADGSPCLTDFGLSRLLNETRGLTTSSELAGSVRWMAPELLFGIDQKATKSSDIWAFGMTILEIITGKRPFARISPDPAVIRTIIDGTLPERPEISEEIWQICSVCWTHEATSRPNASQLLHLLRLESLLASL